MTPERLTLTDASEIEHALQNRACDRAYALQWQELGEWVSELNPEDGPRALDLVEAIATIGDEIASLRFTHDPHRAAIGDQLLAAAAELRAAQQAT
jgi:hypothetical protein